MSRRPPSTATADDVLRYVAGYLEARDGVSPSYKDICDALGVSSNSVIDRSMSEIEAAGKLLRRKRRKRAVEIIKPVTIPRTPTGEPLYFVRIPQ